MADRELRDTDTITWDGAVPTEAKGNVATQMSIISDASGLKLDGDAAAPGINKVYGTDVAGVKGWQSASGGGGGSGILLDFQFVRKTADQSISSNTTLQNDNDLVLAVGANEVWIVHLFALVQGGNGDFKSGWTFPGSATLSTFAHGIAIAASSTVPEADARMQGFFHVASGVASMVSGGGLGVAGGVDFYPVHHVALLINGVNPGNLQFQWAQSSSNALATLVKEDSFLYGLRVA